MRSVAQSGIGSVAARPARAGVVFLAGMFGAISAAAAEQPAATPPKLAVVISIDQCRADYLERFRPYFGEGGFNRLLQGGAVYREAHYPHAVTKTGPGHATILSGVSANVHGVIANEWLDRTTFIQGNCVEDVDSPLVGRAPRAGRSPGGFLETKSGRSPKNLLAATVGDQLKERYGKSVKVFGVSDKDRAAILMAGRRADGAYWAEDGRFVTSKYYRAALPAWIETFNKEHGADTYFGQIWDRLLPAEVYDHVQGPDNGPGEAAENGMGTTFPKTVNGGKPEISSAFYDAFDQTPWNSEMIERFVEQLVTQENLGGDPAPDLLCIGFSQPDRVGHAYGPDSHEIMDSIVRLDRVLAQLFKFLDDRIGAGRWVVVVTADHGVCPLPEHELARPGGGPAGRVDGGPLDAHVKTALDMAFGPLPGNLYWAVRDNSGYHLNPAALQAKHLPAPRVEDELRAALLRYPMIASAYTRTQLESPAPLDAFGEAVRLSFYPPRSQDVTYVVKPYFIERSRSGTTHGTPYEYDTHVPEVWYGAGVKPGVHEERISTHSIAPTLSALLGVTPPPAARGQKLF